MSEETNDIEALEVVISCSPIDPVDPRAVTPAFEKRFAKAVIAIGRATGSDVMLVSDVVARAGTRLLVSRDAIALVDNSDTGSTIDGVHGFGERPLLEGQEVRLGPYALRVRRVRRGP